MLVQFVCPCYVCKVSHLYQSNGSDVPETVIDLSLCCTAGSNGDSLLRPVKVSSFRMS